MTKLVEKKRDRDVVFGFLTVMFALGLWRAWGGSGVAVAVFLALTGLTVLAWVWIRRQPLSEIVVSPEEITVSTRGTVERRIAHRPDVVLTFRSAGNHKHRTWHLGLADDADGPTISMMGFRPPEVAAACRQHGWVLAPDSVF